VKRYCFTFAKIDYSFLITGTNILKCKTIFIIGPLSQHNVALTERTAQSMTACNYNNF
jgi:hypothetical protein